MLFKKVYMNQVCPKQTDSSVLFSEASKEFAQVTHLKNFGFSLMMLRTLKYL